MAASEADSLTTQENTRTSNILALLGIGSSASAESASTAASTLSSAGDAVSDISDLLVTEGAVSGSLYGSYGDSLSQLGLLYGLGAFDK